MQVVSTKSCRSTWEPPGTFPATVLVGSTMAVAGAVRPPALNGLCGRNRWCPISWTKVSTRGFQNTKQHRLRVAPGGLTAAPLGTFPVAGRHHDGVDLMMKQKVNHHDAILRVLQEVEVFQQTVARAAQDVPGALTI